jgi:hypothetical protein
MRRPVLILAIALGIAAGLWLLLSGKQQNADGPAELDRGQPIEETAPPTLAGVSEGELPPGKAHGAATPQADSVQGYTFLVRDWRGAPVESATVQIERETLAYEPLGNTVRGWRPVVSAATDAEGGARLRVSTDVGQRDGPNLRIRVTPPSERDDIYEAWRIWPPQEPTVYEFARSHVIGGRVAHADGTPASGAQVFVGYLGTGSKFVSPAWRETTADAEGKFVVRGIPTTSTFRMHVWAVAAGQEPPARSAVVPNAQDVVLDTRVVELVVP